MTDEMLKKECLEYFRSHPVFRRLLEGFREKYASYGRFAGTVVLKNLTEEERDDLEGFLNRNYHGKKSASVSAERFEKALAESRFAGISGRDVLELYFHAAPEGRQERRQRETEQWKEMIRRAGEAAERMEGERADQEDVERMETAGDTEQEQWSFSLPQLWLQEIEDFLPYLRKRCREADGDLNEVQRLLFLGVKILNALPADAKYLAVFAAEITGNPHAFDAGTKDGKYLEMLVRWYSEKGTKEGTFEQETDRDGRPFPLIEKQRMYLNAGILRDDVSNYALAAGIRAWKKDGSLHEGMKGFFQDGEPVQIPLSVIAGWQSVCCPGKRVYIVENPSVYAMLCGKWKKDCGLMCMNGQPRLSSLLILDFLAEAGKEVWYAGDFDPEGLLIAQKLRQYYRGEFHYWHMSAEDYRKSISAEQISDRRLKMLEKITDPGLTETAAALYKEKLSGYQENIWQEYLVAAHPSENHIVFPL